MVESGREGVGHFPAHLISVQDRDATFAAGHPEVLFEGSYFSPAALELNILSAPSGRNYDVAPDGRFLMIKDGTATNTPSAPGQINVVLNWVEELTRLVPTE